jgi:nickel-dependent lactate racemase
MDIRLAYGKQGLVIHLPDRYDLTIIEPTFVPGLTDPSAALQQALRSPRGAISLKEFVRPGDRVGIVFSDITRPTPHQLILPAILAELSHVSSGHVTLFNALGTHRPNTDGEIREMLGNELVDCYRIVQNDAFDPSTQIMLGCSTFGHEIWINREFIECDVKILTGFIEPHFFAGFSGGGKAIMPGMAGQRTVLGNHDAGMIANPNATWGITRGNPIWEEVREVAILAGKTFLVNVTLNKYRQITGVFAGELDEAHAAGCAFVKNTAMVAVQQPFDIAITTNAGYPLDLNLYQAVKGMSAAAQIVKPGGAIIIAAECWDGIPEHGLYGELLRQAKDPQDLLDTICSPGFLEQDQWQAQIQAQVLLKAEVFVYSDYLTDEQIRLALLQPCRSIETTVCELLEKYGPAASICVLPEGPLTVPYIKIVRYSRYKRL